MYHGVFESGCAHPRHLSLHVLDTVLHGHLQVYFVLAVAIAIPQAAAIVYA